MASVDRADYMDNIKVAEVEQTIQKEKECVMRDTCSGVLCTQAAADTHAEISTRLTQVT